MDISLLPKNVIVYLANKLPDKNILSFSATNRRHRYLVTEYFNEYLLVKKRDENIFLIEKENPKYQEVCERVANFFTKNYKYLRFLGKNFQFFAIRSCSC